ncbi:two-component sensor histidine kinase [Ideonella sp. TBM-1]|uniref:histidine kinase n=2 Tax=Ideonella livida TaxID=2707176 RepID=A0A7C9PHB2_9BURK|nr:two-component sensor histidine kinase [Ideonella livida]
MLLTLAVGLVITSTVVGGITWRSVRAETEALFDYQLRQMALSLRDQGAVAPEQADALADGDLDFVVQVWSLDGRTVYANRAHATLPDRAVLGGAEILVAGERWRTFGVLARGRVIQVAQPVRIRQQLATEAALRAVAPIAWMALPLALGLVWLVTDGLRPLRRVAGALRRRDAASLQPLPATGLPEELSPLVGALNGLLARLDQTLKAQRAFVADAAHELRSPLTALKLQLQMLRRAPDEDSRAEALAQLAGGIDRAARLVEQLLALARSEPGAEAASAPLQPCDLADIARSALADTLAAAQARGTTLTVEGDGPTPLQADPSALRALVRNLADNAVRYSPPGAQVQVRVQPAADGQGPTLVVDDSGPGIPLAERERVFDRFYRRDLGGDTLGSGLGLAIVQAVAQRHGASVRLDDSHLGGLRVEVGFPPSS